MSPRIRRSSLVAAGAIAGVLVLLVAAWAVDTGLHSGGTMRNVALDGQEVGGLSQSDLSMVVNGMVEANEARRVSIQTPAGNLDTTAKDLGLEIDDQATTEAAMESGRDGAFPLRPFAWFGALLAHHDAPVAYRVDEAALTMAMSQVAGANEVDPKEPAILVADDHIVATPGVAGQSLPVADLSDDLVAAAHAAGDPSAPLTVVLDPRPVDPQFSDDEVQEVAQQAIDLSRQPLAVHVAGATTTIEPATLRTWMRAVPSPDSSRLVLGIDAAQASTDVTKAVGDVGTPPIEVTWHVQPDGSVTFTPGSNGTKCCAPDTSGRVVQALHTGQRDVTLDLTVATPEHDAAWAQQMNIHQPIASFTTSHACCQPRVQNIHRISDIVRGAVVAPGETFSLNGFVGPRTSAKGFVEAGVIYNGSFTNDVGGGVSQFTTTLFNTAFFAGLDFVSYQAHTIYISRYPYGREATLSYPEPDLEFTNNTPYGILLWPTYTGTSITVTMYSSPWVTGDQTGQTESPSGRCTRVTTERTRTWVIDGRQEVDSVSALYQPGEGVRC